MVGPIPARLCRGTPRLNAMERKRTRKRATNPTLFYDRPAVHINLDDRHRLIEHYRTYHTHIQPSRESTMASLRLIPLRSFAVVAFLGAFLFKWFQVDVPAEIAALPPQLPIGDWPPWVLHSSIFGILFGAQAATFAFYSTLIYPFFVSPLRHLPMPKGRIPLLGHGRELRIFGPGLMARKWYVFSLSDSIAL